MAAQWSERLLEFYRVREIVLGYCASELGRGRVGELLPTADAAWIVREQELTAEVKSFLEGGGGFDFHDLLDCRDLLRKAQIGGAALEIAELREVLRIADKADEWRAIALNPPAFLQR